MLIGPMVGSFLGLVSRRLPAGRDVLMTRSACEGCGRRLSPLDLVPVVSFVALRGRCRTCRAPIARRYLWLELGCAGFAFWAGLVQPGPLAFLGSLLAWQLLLLAVIDAEHLWLPRSLTSLLIGSGLLIGAGLDRAAFLDQAIGAAAGWLGLTALAWAYRRLRGHEGLGGGDAWLLAGGGAWIGWTGLPMVLLCAAGAGLGWVGWRALAGRPVGPREEVPFGPFLCLGIWLVWLYGPAGWR